MQSVEHPLATPAAPATVFPQTDRRATQRITVTPIVPRRKSLLTARDIQIAEDGGEDEAEGHPS